MGVHSSGNEKQMGPQEVLLLELVSTGYARKEDYRANRRRARC